jgi:hypothetical protein
MEQATELRGYPLGCMLSVDSRSDAGAEAMAFERERIAAVLRESWSLESSGQWLADNPARGQCNVTTLLIHDLFGAEILKTPLPEGDHFYNRIDGERIDLTESQFAAPVAYLDLASDRSEALAGTSQARYEALKAAFLVRFKPTG